VTGPCQTRSGSVKPNHRSIKCEEKRRDRKPITTFGQVSARAPGVLDALGENPGGPSPSKIIDLVDRSVSRQRQIFAKLSNYNRTTSDTGTGSTRTAGACERKSLKRRARSTPTEARSKQTSKKSNLTEHCLYARKTPVGNPYRGLDDASERRS